MSENERSIDVADGREVVLQYAAAPQEVVSYYIQPTPMPGRHPEPEATKAPPKSRKHRGLLIFFFFMAAVLLIASGLAAAWYFGWISPVFDGDYDEAGDSFRQWTYEEMRTAETTIPAYPADPSVRITLTEERKQKMSPQEIYASVNPSTVIVLTELADGTAGIGTGVILASNGYVLTNAHVVTGGKNCMIALYNGMMYPAMLVGYDVESDLAVIKAEAQMLCPAQLGDSDSLCVGDQVYAIGNPLGLELRGTFTDGIVSAINRDVEIDGQTMTLLQTNAALNEGNSGGPLINEFGQIVGINVMKMSTSGYDSAATVEGLGFAIPVSSTLYIVNDLIRFGEVRGEPVIGISVATAPAYLPTGERVLRVYTIDLDGPGEKAGLMVDDLIVAADGERVENSLDLLRIRRRHDIGDELHLSIWRNDEMIELTVILGGC